MSTRLFLAGALAFLALMAGACGAPDTPSPDWTRETPAALDETQLVEFLRVRDGEQLVLVNFWASW